MKCLLKKTTQKLWNGENLSSKKCGCKTTCRAEIWIRPYYIFDDFIADLPRSKSDDDDCTESSNQKPSHEPLDLTTNSSIEDIKSELTSTPLPPAINPHELYTQTPSPSQNYVAVSPGYPIWITPQIF